VKRGNVEKKEFRGTLLAFLTALVSGFAIVINRFFVVKIDPLFFTAIRAFFIGLIFLLISLYSCKWNFKKFKKTSWKNLFLIGLIGGSIAFWLFFQGLKMTTSGRAAFLHKTLPLFATLLAFFFLKEKITKKQVLAMLIMILGVFLISINKISLDVRMGDFLVIAATILWATENTLAKKVMFERESNWVVTFSRMFFGSLILFSIIFITGKIGLLFSLTTQQLIYIIISTLILYLYVLFWYWGLRYINLSKASTILLISPFISLILGAIWLNEKVFFLQILGSVLIIIGAYIILKIKSERRIIEL
jgi:drug/metabolite transporter (DMT)-like permease